MFLVRQASLRVIHASVSKFETVKQAVFASRGRFVFALLTLGSVPCRSIFETPCQLAG